MSRGKPRSAEQLAANLKDAYAKNLESNLKNMEAMIEDVAAKATTDIVRSTLGLEYDQWKNHWRFGYNDKSVLVAAARQAAEKVLDTIELPAITLTARERRAVEDAYRRTYVSVLRGYAMEAAQTKAREDVETLIEPLDPSILDRIYSDDD